ncbi:MAG: hypothetical protein K2X47_09815, partial [Bdellovibrionales bacterium]|nr:hypothetical protein [Bdellovibrionales bacterium]
MFPSLKRLSRLGLGLRIPLATLLLGSIGTSAFGSVDFPFMERLNMNLGHGQCARLSSGSEPNLVQRLKAHQSQIDNAYGIKRSKGDLKDFLLFANSIQFRGYRFLDLIERAEPGRARVVRDALLSFQGDLSLIQQFLKSAEGSYPALHRSFRRAYDSLASMDGLLIRALAFFDGNDFYPRHVLKDIRSTMEGTLGRVVGDLGEMQVGFRLPYVRRASFSLGDVILGRSISEKTPLENARRLANLKEFHEFLTQIPVKLLDQEFQGNLLEKRA